MRERNELFVQSPCHFELRRTQKMTDHYPLYDVPQFRWRFIGSCMGICHWRLLSNYNYHLVWQIIRRIAEHIAKKDCLTTTLNFSYTKTLWNNFYFANKIHLINYMVTTILKINAYCARLQVRHLRSQYRSHCTRISYPNIAPSMKSSSGVSWFNGLVTNSRMASRHSLRPKNKFKRPFPTGWTR